ncbi:MAG: hypothetical protein ACRD1T_19140, partial [Acidimicrobiia bacterium]
MSVRGKPQSRSLAFFVVFAVILSLVIPFAGTAIANHNINNQGCNLEVSPETDENNTGTTHVLTAVLLAADTGNATEKAGIPSCGDGHDVEVDFEIESGPAVTV